jgi:6-phosphogluconolactonase (cycloisomerase 2 family)
MGFSERGKNHESIRVPSPRWQRRRNETVGLVRHRLGIEVKCISIWLRTRRVPGFSLLCLETALLWMRARPAVHIIALVLISELSVSCGGGSAHGGSASAETISGSVSGLLAGNNVVMLDNGGNSTTVSANGNFTFTTAVASGAAYAVTVSVQPPGQNCAVTNGSGTVAGTNVNDVAVSCAKLTYIIGAKVTGLVSNASLVLQNNGGDDLTISSNQPRTFSAPIPSGSAYLITILTQPIGENCAVANGKGTVVNSNVDVAITCTPDPYTVSGSVSGLLTGNTMVVVLNNAPNSAAVSGNGSFTFTAPVLSGSAYAVRVSAQPSGQNCVVMNGSGTVAGANVNNVKVSCSALPYTIGVVVLGLPTVTGLVLQSNGSDNLSLSTGGTFSFSTPIPSGSAYKVTILAQPAGRTCFVRNGSGAITQSNVQVNVTCPWHILYFGETGSSNVLSAYLDGTTGVLFLLDFPSFPTVVADPNGTITAITVDPRGRFAYVASSSPGLSAPGSSVSVLAIDSTTGALTAVVGSPFATAGYALSTITVDPTGRFVYTAHSSSTNVSGYAIDATTGALTAIAGSPFSVAAGTAPTSITVDPSGKFVYVVGGTGAGISAFTINATTGALTAITGAPFAGAAGVSLSSAAADPVGKFLYVAGSAGIQVFTIDRTSGALTAVTGSPFAGTSSFSSVAIDPADKFLYAGGTSGIFQGFAIDSTTGALTAIAGSSYSSIASDSVVIDPSGQFVYAAGRYGAISGFAIDAATGALTAIAPSPFAPSVFGSIAITSVP